MARDRVAYDLLMAKAHAFHSTSERRKYVHATSSRGVVASSRGATAVDERATDDVIIALARILGRQAARQCLTPSADAAPAESVNGAHSLASAIP